MPKYLMFSGRDEAGAVAPVKMLVGKARNGSDAPLVVAEIYQETVASYDAFGDLTDAIQSKTDVDNAQTVTIRFSDLGSAVATVAYVVFNPIDAADAAAKLALPSSRLEIPIGDVASQSFSMSSPLTKVYAISDDAAPVGGSNSLSFQFSRGA